MIRFVFALVFIIISVTLFLIARRRHSKAIARKLEAAADRENSRRENGFERRDEQPTSSYFSVRTLRLMGTGFLVVGLLLGFWSSITTIPTKDIGVKTAFGAPNGYLTNGLHFKAPWDKITLMDGAIQTDTHNDGDNGACVQVRIAHQIVACANMYVKWKINEPSVDELFQNYREFSNIRDALVDKNLQSVLNHVFESYDPLAVDADGNASAPQLAVLSKDALAQMQDAVGNKVTILDLNVTVLVYNQATQQKIDALQAQVAQTRIAQQSRKTAEEQAKANEILAKSVSNDPNVLVSSCFDLLGEAVSKGYQLPAGFSCWPGGGSAVIVPGTTTPSTDS